MNDHSDDISIGWFILALLSMIGMMTGTVIESVTLFMASFLFLIGLLPPFLFIWIWLLEILTEKRKRNER